VTVSFDDVRDAHRAITGLVQHTPILRSETLSSMTGTELYLKFENHQFTSSFKERGAANRILALDDRERASGVIAASAGNHAQGVAYHARRLGLPCRIVMPAATPLTKVRNTRALGAEVVLTGTDFDEAAAAATQLAADTGATMIHPFDDPLVIAGQGTVGVEMLTDVPDLDVVVVPVGGGGLISGIALAARRLSARAEVIGVQSQQFDPIARRFGHEAASSGSTIAEGIAVAHPGELTAALIAANVDDVVTVSEPSIESAIVMLLDIEKTLVEGAGAAGLAAVLEDPERFRGRRVGLVLSGGNIDLRTIADAIGRSLNASGRIATLEVHVADRPGELAGVLTTIAEANANVLSVRHDRNATGLPLRHARVEIVLETLDEPHLEQVLDALARRGSTALRLPH
jgi:threonine dehydratase